jgi:hypothetical protein
VVFWPRKKHSETTMPVAQTRLEQLQVLKLLQSVRAEDKTQIEKLATNGVPDLINYSGTILSHEQNIE